MWSDDNVDCYQLTRRTRKDGKMQKEQKSPKIFLMIVNRSELSDNQLELQVFTQRWGKKRERKATNVNKFYRAHYNHDRWPENCRCDGIKSPFQMLPMHTMNLQHNRVSAARTHLREEKWEWIKAPKADYNFFCCSISISSLSLRFDPRVWLCVSFLSFNFIFDLSQRSLAEFTIFQSRINLWEFKCLAFIELTLSGKDLNWTHSRSLSLKLHSENPLLLDSKPSCVVNDTMDGAWPCVCSQAARKKGKNTRATRRPFHQPQLNISEQMRRVQIRFLWIFFTHMQESISYDSKSHRAARLDCDSLRNARASTRSRQCMIW